MTNEEFSLINSAKKGDMRAFEELIYKYDKKVLAIAYSYRNSRDEALDIYQEVFLRVFRNLKSFEGKCEFSTWLHRITVNLCLTHYTQKKRHTFIPLHQMTNDDDEIVSYSEGLLADSNRSDDDLLGQEKASYLKKVIDSLPDKQKMAVTLKYYEDFKIREIADIMNCNEGTIKRYLFDAIRKMRSKIKK